MVSREEWQRACDQLLIKEKAATKARDALSAERRRLPMVRIEKDYVFDRPESQVRLLDLFEGRRQLIIYHFMFPLLHGWPNGRMPGLLDGRRFGFPSLHGLNAGVRLRAGRMAREKPPTK
ncbi:MAG TPA: DUF899 family protein [Chthoniobacterales bacterium]